MLFLGAARCAGPLKKYLSQGDGICSQMAKARLTNRIVRGLLYRIVVIALALAILSPKNLHLIRPITESLSEVLLGLMRSLYDL